MKSILKSTFLLLTLSILFSCGGDEKKITCTKLKLLPEFMNITFDKIGDVSAEFDERYEKEIMGKQFGQQHFCTLIIRVKNTSCMTANFTANFELVTFSQGEIHSNKTKEIAPGEEVEIKSNPIAVKDVNDVSDKSVKITPENIGKKVKVTYEKRFADGETKCQCDVQNDDIEHSAMITVVKEEELRCEEEIKNFKAGQIGGNVKPSDKKSDKKASASNECEMPLENPAKATVATDSDKLLIRSAPNTDASVIIKADKGVKVTITCYSKKTTVNGKSGRWARVNYAGKEGWAFEGFLKLD